MGKRMDGYRLAGAAGADSPGVRRPGRPRVLIVDDEPMIGATLKVLLSEDHDVEVAASGDRAKALLQDDRDFDLVLCDLMMPGLSGMGLHRWIASHEPALARRVVFMTGGVFTDEARDFLDGVPNRRIDKPFDSADLIRLLEEEIGGAGSRR